ncbi:tRNA nucleotidyltransferase/poly(A) polymerase [secondary endosymbiont of Heteropsylla cubana]|uniref:CCA-adding enzyme n=1 Tax=secondary endosymbiont of Heteropsylla cubana TaxID=134287 RepID=J3VUF2_9ENTR|nr:multifunctional CCA addition/repair protein [secondary endosymbiont of Heteropsylla cubana]AFP85776.1 tRNA nucleotidyltransferase/poly(A) polymerase [secondary endosymbiont of Heteropsylla cubana]
MKKYLVGGAVRDSLLKLPIKERDWVVVGSTPEEMQKRGYQQVGKDFPVFLHPKSREEHALARTERKIGQGYTGFICHASQQVTLEEDLHRRDLTINAIACDDKGQLIDPYHGEKDLHHRWLRHISDAFGEDPLRVLRVARFAARFAYLNFRIAPETMKLMLKMTNELQFLSPERVWKETEQALSTYNPEIYFQILRECNALKVLFPELDALFDIPGSTKRNPKISAGIHTLMTASIAARLTDDIAVRFSAFCHDLGKTLTSQEIWPKRPIHNLAGVKVVESLCQRLKVPHSIRNLAKIVVRYHDLLHTAKIFSSKTLIAFFSEIDAWRRPVRLEQIILSSKANALVRCKYNDHGYFQEEFLRKAFRIAHSVKVQEILKEGFIGKKIGEELNRRRQQAIKRWQLRVTTRNKKY